MRLAGAYWSMGSVSERMPKGASPGRDFTRTGFFALASLMTSTALMRPWVRRSTSPAQRAGTYPTLTQLCTTARSSWKARASSAWLPKISTSRSAQFIMSVLLANVACQIQFDKRELIVKPDHPVSLKPETVGFRPETAADAWLGLLAARGVEYLFANGGTDFAPVVEAYAKGQALGWRLPEVVIVPHVNLGVAMAHGYTMITGRPQAMMVHVGVGTANAVNGLMNASRMNIPILFSAGRTPLTESGALPGARNNYIHWAQEHFDQGGMLREFMKWDYELRHAEQVET